MDSNLKFGNIEVSCEGYDHPDDPYVLRGSCGLEYTLEYTNQGKANQQQNQHYSNQHHSSSYHHPSQGHGSGFSIKSLLMLGIIAFIFYNIYRQCATMGTHAGAGNGAGQWGPGGPGGAGGAGGYPPGGWGPGGAPPGSGGPYYGGGGSCAPPPPTYAPTWRPGFWTGLAAGGFMGNWFNRGPRYGHNTYGTRYSTPSFGSSSFSSGPSFSSGGGGSSTRTASGFGGTRRR